MDASAVGSARRKVGLWSEFSVVLVVLLHVLMMPVMPPVLVLVMAMVLVLVLLLVLLLQLLLYHYCQGEEEERGCCNR